MGGYIPICFFIHKYLRNRPKNNIRVFLKLRKLLVKNKRVHIYMLKRTKRFGIFNAYILLDKNKGLHELPIKGLGKFWNSEYCGFVIYHNSGNGWKTELLKLKLFYSLFEAVGLEVSEITFDDEEIRAGVVRRLQIR